MNEQQDYFNAGVITKRRLSANDSVIDYILGLGWYQIAAFCLATEHPDAPYSPGSTLIIGIKLNDVAGLLIAVNHTNAAIYYGRISNSVLTWYSADAS